MKKTFYILILSLFSMGIYSQIKPNETLVFSGSYELKGLMTNIAQVTFRTESMKTSTKTYLHLSLEAATFSKWDSFFKIRDLYESYVEPNTLKPSLYKRKISEGGYNKSEKYTFTGNGTTISSSTIKGTKPEVKNTFKIGASSVDVVTLIYKIRTIDFSKLKTGQSMPFTVVFNQKEFPVTLKLMGIETVTAGNLGKKECYKLSIGAKTNALRGTDKNLIWLSTDSKRIPCLVKFSIPVGVGQLTLLKATGI
jgi:hypothetical protein